MSPILAYTTEKFENTLEKRHHNPKTTKAPTNTEPTKDKESKNSLLKKKFLGLNVIQWGYLSVATNGFSVVVQLSQLFRTRSAKSFDMTFIFLMTILNATYFVLGVLTNNIGLAIATFFFVYYNLTVMYFYYSGK